MSTLVVKVLTDIKKFPTRNGGEMGRCMVAIEKENFALPLIASSDHFKHLILERCVRLVKAVRSEKHITVGARSKVCDTVKWNLPFFHISLRLVKFCLKPTAVFVLFNSAESGAATMLTREIG